MDLRKQFTGSSGQWVNCKISTGIPLLLGSDLFKFGLDLHRDFF